LLDCTYGRRNHQSGKNDADESKQNGDQPSERRLKNNITVADGQPRDKGKVKGFPKLHFFNVSDNNRNTPYQSNQGQKDGMETPDNQKKMVTETAKISPKITNRISKIAS